MNNIDLTDLTRDDLLRLQGQVKDRLKSFRPYRIKERVVQCGKTDCWCVEGPDGHGPYLFASYRQDGRTKTASLGLKKTVQEMTEDRPSYPDIFDYFTTPDYKYEAMPRNQTFDWTYATLTPDRFLDRYGVSQEDDNFNRPSKFWGPRSEYERCQAVYQMVLEVHDLPFNKWSDWGVSTLSGVAKLEALETQGYYLKVD